MPSGLSIVIPVYDERATVHDDPRRRDGIPGRRHPELPADGEPVPES